MSDRNPMLQNLNNPVAGLGIVPGKAMLDDDLVECRKANARNPLRAVDCYPGGDNNLNHNIQVGDLVFGRRGTRDVESMDGEPNELVTASVAGECWNDYTSRREMEREYYFVGVAAGEENLEHPMDSNQVDARNGFGTIRVGTVSVINNGAHTFYPGDYVRWRMPKCGLDNTLRVEGPGGHSMALTEGGDPSRPYFNTRARYGEESTQFRPVIEPFDPSDLGADLAGVFSTIMMPGANGGVSGLDAKDVLINVDRRVSDLTTLQDEALAYRFGLFGVFAAMLEPLARKGYITIHPDKEGREDIDANIGPNIQKLFKNIGVYGDVSKTTLANEALASVFMQNIGAEATVRQSLEEKFSALYGKAPYSVATSVPADDNAATARIRLNGLEMMVRAMASTVDAARRNIIGRCMSASAPGDTTDLLLGHTL